MQANQAGDKISATVEAIAPGIDLALLKLDDESFFDSHPALQRTTDLPQIKDPVLVYGYPTGGSSLPITKGIVSRVEFAGYGYPCPAELVWPATFQSAAETPSGRPRTGRGR